VNTVNEVALIDEVTTALERLGLKVLAVKGPRAVDRRRAGAWLRIGRGKEHADYLVEAKRTVTPATLGAVVAQLRELAAAAGRPTLLAADYLTPPVADALRTHQQQFADAAGNAYLEGPGVLVYVTGRKPPQTRATTRIGKAFTANGLKILFVLLCRPALAEAPHRAIAAAAGVALGAVPAVLADLQAAGHVLVAGKNRRLNATKRLLDEWALAYARTLRPKTLHAVYNTPNFDNWREWQLDPQEVRWGGEPAANLLVGYLKPGVLTLYAHKLPPKLAVKQRMVPARATDQPPVVEVRRPFWGDALQPDERPDTVPPALVYADLLATGDGRCIETAQMIYDRHLARLLPAK
jgi:hypothetical protein